MHKEVSLSRCPFCGGRAELVNVYVPNTKWNGWKVIHNQCSVIKPPFQTSSFRNIEHAVKAWNRRFFDKEGGTA